MELYLDEIRRNRQLEDDNESTPGKGPDDQQKPPFEEIDADDLVHSTKLSVTTPDAELDPDEAIHENALIRPPESGMADPDDLVHGA